MTFFNKSFNDYSVISFHNLKTFFNNFRCNASFLTSFLTNFNLTDFSFSLSLSLSIKWYILRGLSILTYFISFYYLFFLLLYLHIIISIFFFIFSIFSIFSLPFCFLFFVFLLFGGFFKMSITFLSICNNFHDDICFYNLWIV